MTTRPGVESVRARELVAPAGTRSYLSFVVWFDPSPKNSPRHLGETSMSVRSHGGPRGPRLTVCAGPRLRLEALEDRAVPAVSILNNLGGGYAALSFNQSGG